MVRNFFISVLLYSVFSSLSYGQKCQRLTGQLLNPKKISSQALEEFKSSKTRALMNLASAVFAGGLGYIVYHRFNLQPNFLSEHLSNFAETLPYMAAMNAAIQKMTGRLVLTHPWLVRQATILSGIALNALSDFQPYRHAILPIGGYDIADFGMGLLGVATYDILDRLVHRHYANQLGRIAQ